MDQTLRRSKMEVNFAPLDFFEAPYVYDANDYKLEIGSGVASIDFSSIEPDHARFWDTMSLIFDRRKIETRRQYSFEGEPRIVRFDEKGKAHYTLYCQAAEVTLTGGVLHFIHRDKFGNVVRDTRAEELALEAEKARTRIDETARNNNNLLNLDRERTSLLVKLQRSYASAINDPDEEFVLYARFTRH